MKKIATIVAIDENRSFDIVLRGTQLFAQRQDGAEEEIADGDFAQAPSNKDVVERVYSLYAGPEWMIEDCIEYAD